MFIHKSLKVACGLLACCLIGNVAAQLSSTTSGSSTIPPPMSSLPPIQQKPKPAQTYVPPPRHAPPQPVAQALGATEDIYLHPGILVFLEGGWIGSDNLLNISNNIGVAITLTKPEDITLDISDADIKNRIEDIFKGVGIVAAPLRLPGQPPLPIYQMEFLIYPIERGYVVCCDARLFESVSLPRFRLDEGTAFQAITWEKKNLLVMPTKDLRNEIMRVVDESAQSFAERFRAFELRRKTLR